jgi:phosphotransacetylase
VIASRPAFVSFIPSLTTSRDLANRMRKGTAMADLKIRYEEMLAGRKGQPPLPSAVVYPLSQDALIGAIEAAKAGLIAPQLVGPREQIREIAAKAKVDVSPYEIVPAADVEESATVAAKLAGAGTVGALMKGSLHTDHYMHAVLQRENGLRTGRLLSHCMLIAAPAYARPIIVSDAAVNIAPDLDQKRDIVQNAIILARAIGVSKPKVAILAAIETVNSKMQATLDAAALAKMADRCQIVGGIVDGPLDLDIAVDKEAARIKRVETPVAGEADILIAPNIEAGNLMYKELAFMAGAQSAGLVMGARVPLILTSRADTPQSRLFSCALAVLFADAIDKDPSLLRPLIGD